MRKPEPRVPTYEELTEFAKWTQKFQLHAIEVMRGNKLKIDDLNDPMQKLAFSFYTDLCEIENRARQLFED
jgi:hypothetical protein